MSAPVTRVIGLGSPFGEDRAGWLVVDRLQGRVPALVEVVALDRPGAAIVNWMRNCGHLVLIDAVLAPERRGDYARLSPDELARPSPVSGHTVDLAQSLALAEALDQRPTSIDIYGIFISDLSDISNAVSRSVERLASHLATDLQTPGATSRADR